MYMQEKKNQDNRRRQF